MKRAAGLSMAAVLLISAAPIMTGGILVDEDKHLLDYANSRIQGLIVDYTRNSGQDLRIFSPALGKPIDMYVYLPPHYDPRK